MRFEPWTVPAGILVSLAALIAIVAWLALNRSRPPSPTNASHDAQARRK
jgi:hypothetical protein